MRGTKRERSPGVWELRAYAGKDLVTGDPRQISRTFRGGQKQAETALAKLVTEAAAGKFGGTNATVSVLLDAWLRHVAGRKDRSPATVAVYRQSVKAHLRPALGATRVDNLTVRQLDDLYRTMAERGSSVYVIRQAHSAIRAALALAVRWGWTPTNVALLADPPSPPEREVTAPTADQVRRIVAHLELSDPDLAHLLLLGALTGSRRAELCALRWDDWDGEQLHVTRRLVEAAGHVTERTGTKGGKGRHVVLDEFGIAVLGRLRALQEARAASASAKPPANGYLLSADGLGGRPRRPKSVSRAVGAAARELGMPDVHLHSFRHYAVTEMIAAGTDVRTAANRVGHSDPSITLRIYAHRIEARDREAAAVLGRALMPAESPNPPGS